jgi:hypothetical protein
MRDRKAYAVLFASVFGVIAGTILAMMAVSYQSHVIVFISMPLVVISLASGLWSLRSIRRTLSEASITITVTANDRSTLDLVSDTNYYMKPVQIAPSDQVAMMV